MVLLVPFVLLVPLEMGLVVPVLVVGHDDDLGVGRVRLAGGS